MRIEYVTTGLRVGGAEKVVFDLASGMKARGHDVSVTSLLQPEAYAESLKQQGIDVRSLGIDRERKDVARLASALLAYRRAVAQRKPEIIHSHMVHANLFARAAVAFQTAPRLICTIHNTYEGGRLRDLCYALTNWASDLDTTISEAATRRFVSDGVLPRRTATVYSGVEVPSRSRPPVVAEDGHFRWIAVGRLETQKDYPTLLRAMARLRDASLTIAGDGSLRQPLEAMARHLGVEDRVVFLGTRTDIPEQFANHDGYVLSSSWEGFGLALAEAMASGLPVVATRSGGPSEIVGEDGACGLVVAPGDEAALAEAMEAVARQGPGARFEMGNRGRDRIARLFSRDGMLDRWEAIYARLGRRL